MRPDLDEILAQLRQAAPLSLTDPLPVTLVTRVLQPGERVPLAAPAELQRLWAAAGGVEIHRDETYGQWGLLLHGPAWSKGEAARWARLYPLDPLQPREWLVGEFLGDCERVLVQPDGGVVVVRPMEHRPAWPRVAGSLAEFLARVFAAPDRKYWERPAAAA